VTSRASCVDTWSATLSCADRSCIAFRRPFKVNLRTDRSGHWLENSILHLVEEAASDRAGSEAMLAKLSEALFVDTLRRYIAGLPEQETGWLAGARDPVVGRSLSLLHRKVQHP